MLNGKYVVGGVNIGNVEIAGFPKEYRGENCVRNENVQNESVESVGQERNVGVGGGGGVTIPVMEYVEKGDKGCRASFNLSLPAGSDRKLSNILGEWRRILTMKTMIF